MIFKRKIYPKLLDFKKEEGKYSLLIEGARRIGKSTIVREFAQREYDSFVFIDFQEDKERAREPFDYLPDLDSFFQSLMLNYNTILHQRKSLIVFDEVQFFPKARECLKQFVRDGRYDYIATGSLLSIKENVKDILIPSEEERITMHPMDFEEFCWATGNEMLFSYLRACYREGKRPMDDQHRKAMRLFRIYMAIGGMPQAISDYVGGKSFQDIDKVKRIILRLYEDDLRKLDRIGSYRADLIFKSIPHALESHSRVFRDSRIFSKDSQIKRNTFGAIEDSKIVNICRLLEQPSIDFNLYAQERRFKIYMGDTGLLTTRVYEDSDVPMEEGIYRRLIADKLSTNDGMLFENAVAQQFVAQGRELYYHTFPIENRHVCELDFLLRRGKKILPVEVKSSTRQSHVSLDRAMEKYSSILEQPVILSPKNYCKARDITYLPVYMAGLLAERKNS